MKRYLLLTGIVFLLALSKFSYAENEIHSISYPSVSADGKTIYFSAWGDIWSAPRDGSSFARRLTDNVAYEGRPMPSPDGKQIAFLSDRFGNFDIFVMPESGGAAKRITWDSNTDYIYDWKSDGSAILAYTMRQDFFGACAYEIYLNGRKPKRISGPDHDEHVFTSYLNDDSEIVYTRGPGDWAMQKWHGQNTYDIWTLNFQTGKHTQITDYDGADLWPQPSPDGKTIYFVSSRDGTYNLWSYDRESKQYARLTDFEGEGPIWPKISNDGDEIVFEVFGEAYIYSITSGTTEKIKIQFSNDPKHEMALETTIANQVAEYSISPNGNYYAVVVFGDIYILKNPDIYKEDEKPEQDLSRTFHVVETPAREMHLSWHPDSTKIAYISDRNDQYDVYTLDLITLEEKRITNTERDEWYPDFAPHGEKLAYYSGNRLLKIYDLKEEKESILHEGQIKHGPWLMGYEWSPDGKWIAYVEDILDSIADVFIINIEEKKPINVSFTPDWDSSPSWSPDGKYLAFHSNFESGSEVMLLELSPEKETYDIDLLFPDDKPKPEPEEKKTDEAPENVEKQSDVKETTETEKPSEDVEEVKEEKTDAEKEKEEEVKPVIIDLDRIHLRAKSIVSMNADSYSPVFSPDSKYILFVSTHEGTPDWWTVTVDGNEYAKLTSAETKDYPQWSKDGTKLHFIDNGRITFLTMAGSKANGGGDVAVRSRAMIDQYVIWEQMLKEGWRYLRESFYDKDMHGVDWNAVLKLYLPRVRDCGTIYEYANLYRLMLGELNASHLSYYSTESDREAPSEETAELGVVFDESWNGPGWFVKRVIKDSPAWQTGSRLYEGDVILEIDSHVIQQDDDPAILLRNKVGIPLKLKVRNDKRVTESDNKGEAVTLIGEPEYVDRDVILKPTNKASMRGLLYHDWVDENRKTVYDKSDFKIGYQHIRVMYEGDLDKFRRELFTESMDKDALIIDVRFNSGGHIATDILDLLRREPAYRHKLRDSQGGFRPALTWDGPIVVLINAHSFSNAEIFGHIMRDFGLATIIGESTGGGVISTYDFTLMDGSSFRMPSWENARLNGENMEQKGVIPDIFIHIDPELLLKGEDNQLNYAIDYLLKQLKHKN